MILNFIFLILLSSRARSCYVLSLLHIYSVTCWYSYVHVQIGSFFFVIIPSNVACFLAWNKWLVWMYFVGLGVFCDFCWVLCILWLIPVCVDTIGQHDRIQVVFTVTSVGLSPYCWAFVCFLFAPACPILLLTEVCDGVKLLRTVTIIVLWWTISQI